MNWYKLITPNTKSCQNKIKINKDFKSILINMKLNHEEKEFKRKVKYIKLNSSLKN